MSDVTVSSGVPDFTLTIGTADITVQQDDVIAITVGELAEVTAIAGDPLTVNVTLPVITVGQIVDVTFVGDTVPYTGITYLSANEIAVQGTAAQLILVVPAPGSANFIESGNLAWTASADLYLTGYNGGAMTNFNVNALNAIFSGEVFAGGLVYAYGAGGLYANGPGTNPGYIFLGNAAHGERVRLGGFDNRTLTISCDGVTNSTVTSSSQFIVNPNTASSSPSTGALVVTGGAGIGGNINAGGTITSAGANAGFLAYDRSGNGHETAFYRAGDVAGIFDSVQAADLMEFGSFGTYSNVRILNGRSGYAGINFQTSQLHVMFTATGAGGIYNAGAGGWPFYYDQANAKVDLTYPIRIGAATGTGGLWGGPPTSSILPVGTLQQCYQYSGGTLIDGATCAGSAIQPYSVSLGPLATQTGTWQNVSGASLSNGQVGSFVRIA
jgi:hypothetical protein